MPILKTSFYVIVKLLHNPVDKSHIRQSTNLTLARL